MKERKKESKKERKKERERKQRKQRKHEKRKVWRELDELYTVATASLRRTPRKRTKEKKKKLSQRQRLPITPCLRADWSCSGRCPLRRLGRCQLSSPQSDRPPGRRRKRKTPKNKKHGQIADTEASRDG